jgi:hypothetical protein
MEIAGHCSFCEHKKYIFEKGNLCGLTQKKADFIEKCPKIRFGATAKEKIIETNIEYRQLQLRKPKILRKMILIVFAGLLLIATAIFVSKFIFMMEMFSPNAITEEEAWFVFSVIYGIAGVIWLFEYAFKPFIKHKNITSVIASQKKHMDYLFALYDYDYTINYKDENSETAVQLFRSNRPL